MICCNKKKLFPFIFLSLILVVFFCKNILIQHIEDFYKDPEDMPLVLWWTDDTLMGEMVVHIFCGYTCKLSAMKTRLPDARVILFYGSSIKMDDMPLPRSPQHLWALLHEEAPKNIPFIQYANVLQHFNFTSTFSRYSDAPLTTMGLPRNANLTSSQYVVPIAQKNQLRQFGALSAIAFVSSNCDTENGRPIYVEELMQYIDIDSYGSCLNNRKLPKSLTENYLNRLDSPEFLKFFARYKFFISFENAVCHDYITEKFWLPLAMGVVPIYFGSPTAGDWQPNKRSVIYIADFRSPKDLAEFIIRLDKNDTAYNEYLKHKYDKLNPISNKLLKDELLQGNVSRFDDIFRNFQCEACRLAHTLPPTKIKMATRNHYNCPQPLLQPEMNQSITTKIGMPWQQMYSRGRCIAKMLHYFFQRNLRYYSGEVDILLKTINEIPECQTN